MVKLPLFLTLYTFCPQSPATKLTESFIVKLASGLDNIKKSTGLEIKIFDLNSKMKNMPGEYKNKGFGYQDACISNVADQLGGPKKNIKILSKLVFKGKLDVHYNPRCSKETLESYFFFDYFCPTAKPHHEVGKEIYQLIKGNECESTHTEQ